MKKWWIVNFKSFPSLSKESGRIETLPKAMPSKTCANRFFVVIPKFQTCMLYENVFLEAAKIASPATSKDE